ncbi:hypothetical protein BFP72_17830 [Reichenbachiella sp. 5M10]|uniref:hypothetical protein n=1 Tax=Reichenbachiella sp. 5M10 TaxID=1889772 RepID=UPI000C14B15C|nr:hypothetical protein [Reichenbachiella sp. 5M10]PIB37132.1 hypothetical protein BFP72_17830 [Reichenbachiella sp. 5M10]
MRNFEILDCTLRDGGYYTDWDFDRKVVNTYLNSMNSLPIDYIEIGYRSKKMEGYLGQYFYLPEETLFAIKEKLSKKIVIILNEKSTTPDHVDDLLLPCKGIVDLVRIAVDPQNVIRAIKLAVAIKNMGFDVAFNVMYMSEWKGAKSFLSDIKETNGIVDYFYMVDSFGGVFPNDLKEVYHSIKERLNMKIGFHGHNNLELALINTLEALKLGVDIVDSTILGMGRGAGNLKTELLLTTLNSTEKLEVEFNALSKSVDAFGNLQKEHEWGTNLPYMVSGANSLPQKDVMDWMTKRYFSLNSIIRALSNKSKGIEDNVRLKNYDFSIMKADKVLIIGGGSTVISHISVILKFLKENPGVTVIHASSKNSHVFKEISNKQVFCLVGNEGHRLEEVFDESGNINGLCILPPFPRAMGTYIPSALAHNAYELKGIDFTDLFDNSHTALALQTCVEMKSKYVYLAGYDGYDATSLSKREKDLFIENEYQFKKAKEMNLSLISLTRTHYEELEQNSIYSL